MKALKILNVYHPSGNLDYKGLDLSKIIPGSQFYPHDLNLCYLSTLEEVFPEHSDIIEVTTQEVEGAIQDYRERFPPQKPVEEEVNELKTENASLRKDQTDLVFELMMKGVL